MDALGYFIMAAAGVFYLLLVAGGGVRAFRRGGFWNHLLLWMPLAALIPAGLYYAGPDWVANGNTPRVLLAVYACIWLVMGAAYLIEPLRGRSSGAAVQQ